MKTIRIVIIEVIMLTSSLLCCAQIGATDSLSYAFGMYFGSSLKENGVTSINAESLIRGLNDAISPDESSPSMGIKQALNYIDQYFNKIKNDLAASNLAEGNKFLEQNAKNKDVVVDASGLQYKVIKQGSGLRPQANSSVTAHYRGTHINGEVFDSSYDRGEPINFSLNRVIKGWSIGLQLMPVGSKYIFYIPASLAYGTNTPPGGEIQPNEVLIFEVELLSIDLAN